jgi:transcriptional regulator with XRE-family HTH domain
MMAMQSAAGTTVRKSDKRPSLPAFGRGTGVPDPIDLHVGSRIRTRRIYLHMRQEELARQLGLTFQQVQKYESGANRVAASRLWEIAGILGMPVAYFFPKDGEKNACGDPPDDESIELASLFYSIADPAMRQQLFDTVKRIAEKHSGARPPRRGA